MSETRIRGILLAAGAVLAAAFCLAPFLYMCATALSERPDFLAPDGSFAFTLDHVRAVLADPTSRFPEYLRNSLAVAGASAVVTVIVASLAAYAFTRLPIAGKGPLLMGVLCLSMFPPVSLVGYLYKAMAGLGWIDTWIALILPYVAWTLPLSLWILVSYFGQIPRDLDRAALIDGATRLQILRRIVGPVAAPGIFSTALLAFVFAFNEFLFALMLTTDASARTVPVGIAMFEGLHGEVPWGEVMAAAAVTTIPVVALTLIFQRHIVQGLTRGAVKS